MHKSVREYVRKTSGLSPLETDIAMIIDYFSYAVIYGEDVVPEGQQSNISSGRAYMYDWSKLIKGVPDRTIRGHLAIQKELEMENPEIIKDFT